MQHSFRLDLIISQDTPAFPHIVQINKQTHGIILCTHAIHMRRKTQAYQLIHERNAYNSKPNKKHTLLRSLDIGICCYAQRFVIQFCINQCKCIREECRPHVYTFIATRIANVTHCNRSTQSDHVQRHKYKHK